MLEPPFDLVGCSWPRPVERAGGRWTSPPDWDAPPMPAPYWPQPRWAVVADELCWAVVADELCWAIDWRDLFRRGVPGKAGSEFCGEMRGFHVVFRLRVNGGGALTFWDEDGCLVRRGGRVVHADPVAHELTRHAVDVRAGDLLEVAQWHEQGGWVWGACWDRPAPAEPLEVLVPCRDAVLRRLGRPEGPPLKVFTDGEAPARTVVALYSMILNGYAPAEVLLFGEHQWSAEARALFAATLPFAQVVPTSAVSARLATLGGRALGDLAQRHWYVLKACACLLYPPAAFCAMDDDVLVLDSVADALAAFQRHDLVFAADTDYGQAYLDVWGPVLGRAEPLPTGTFNAGLYWMRNNHDPHTIAAGLLRVGEASPGMWPDDDGALHPMDWEQGLIAVLFAHNPTHQLPSQRYFYPVFDGMPGGFLDYDYARNPCGFVSIHFGGVHAKPADEAMLALAPDVLYRRRLARLTTALRRLD